MQLRVAEQYVGEFGNLAKQANTLVVPANLSDVASMIALATNVIQGATDDEPNQGDPPPFGRNDISQV